MISIMLMPVWALFMHLDIELGAALRLHVKLYFRTPALEETATKKT